MWKNLYQIADIVIDNCGDFEDSCMLMDGMKQKVAPTSTITGAAIINSLVIQVVEKLLKQQIEPPIFIRRMLMAEMRSIKRSSKNIRIRFLYVVIA